MNVASTDRKAITQVQPRSGTGCHRTVRTPAGWISRRPMAPRPPRSTAPCWPFFDSGEEFGHFNITVGELARHGPALSAIDANGPALPYPIDRRPGQRHQLNA